MKFSFSNAGRRFGRKLAHKLVQTQRLSRKTAAFAFLLAGAALVALTSLVFAKMADWALEQNAHWVQQYPWYAWLALPLGLPLIVWLTRRFARQTLRLHQFVRQLAAEAPARV